MTCWALQFGVSNRKIEDKTHNLPKNAYEGMREVPQSCITGCLWYHGQETKSAVPVIYVHVTGTFDCSGCTETRKGRLGKLLRHHMRHGINIV